MTTSGDLLGPIDQPAPDPISEASSKGINAAVAAVMGAEGMVARKAEQARLDDERARREVAAKRAQGAAKGSGVAADQLREGLSAVRDAKPESGGGRGATGGAPESTESRPATMRMSDGTFIHPPEQASRPPRRFADSVHAMKVWKTAADTGPHDATAARAMSDAERYLSETQPDLMRRYYTHLDAGRAPKEAMGLGLAEMNTPAPAGSARAHPGPDPRRHPRTPEAGAGTQKPTTPIKSAPTAGGGTESLTRSAS